MQLRTQNYPLDEVSSSLQKEIRRGQAQHALYWAKELIRSGFSAYLWRRLFVIASEDVGLADDQIPGLLHALHENWLAAAKKAKDESVTTEEAERASLILVHAVLRLCAAPKNREVADANTVLDMEWEQGLRLDPPDYALDGHTARGRARGRGGANAEVFFQQEGRRVAAARVIDDNRFFARLCSLLKIPLARYEV